LTSKGAFVWVKSFGAGSFSVGGGIAVDNAGNVYTTGSFAGTGSFSGTGRGDNLSSPVDNTTYVIKLNSIGNVDWIDVLGSGSNTDDARIAVDRFGNVYTSHTSYC
jgi:hypothetical protein